MSSSASPVLGFLTLGEHAELGVFGGYLLLNAAGRPLEFHCTAPIKPNRAQEILYGASLKPYLYGEQIGQTLVKKGKSAAAVVFTDIEPALATRSHVDMPLALVAADEASLLRPALLPFRLGSHHVAVATAHADDRPMICERMAHLLDHLDLLEPFTRIREALDEAHKTARPAA
jgi:hypothetical protein